VLDAKLAWSLYLRAPALPAALILEDDERAALRSLVVGGYRTMADVERETGA
jgi:hypothetical protein